MLQIHNNQIKKHNLNFPLKSIIYKLVPLEIVLCSYSGYLGNDSIELTIDLVDSILILSSLGYTMVLERTTIGTVVKMNIDLLKSRLHMVPHPLILGRHSHLEQSTSIKMDSESSLVFLDSFVAGRVHMNESFEFLKLKSTLLLLYENELVLYEKTLVTPKDLKFRPFTVHGTLILVNFPKTFHSICTKELSIAVSSIKYKNSKSIGQIIRIGAKSSDYFWETMRNMTD